MERRGLLAGWRLWAAIAAAVVVLYAVVGFFVVPPIARAQIEKQARALLHREATVERVRFNPFTLAATVEKLDLRDRDGTDLFKLDRLLANFELSSLFRRAWTFREIVVERPAAVGRILADGKPSVADLFESSRPEETARKDGGLPRILVSRLALTGGRLDFVDESRTPRFAETISPLDLEISDLSTIPDQKGDHAVTIGIGSGTRVVWSGRQTVEPLRLEGRLEVSGVSLPRVWSYFAPEGALQVRRGQADLTCSYDVRKESGSFAVSVGDASLTARGLAAGPRGESGDWLEVGLVEARGVRVAWPASKVEIDEIRLAEPRAVAWVGKDGVFNWSAAFPAAPAAAEPAPAPAASPWTVTIGAVDLANGTGRFEDRTVDPPVPVDLAEVAIRAETISGDLATPVAVRGSARVNGTGTLRLSGSVVPSPFAMDLDGSVDALALVPFAPYLRALPGAEVRSGVAGFAGKLAIGPGSPWFRLDGAGTLDGLHVAGAGTDRLVAWQEGKAKGFRLTLGPDRLRIEEIALGRAFVKVFIDREGSLNLSRLAASEPSSGPAFPVDVASIAIRDGEIDFTDESLILPFGTRIHSAKGEIRDLSTTSAAAARLDLTGRIAERGIVHAGGALRISDPFASTDIGVTFREIRMPDLTPYVAQFAGYSVKGGSLDLDVRYRIEERRLVGDHRAVATDLSLGPKVEGAEDPGLPVRLAIALLKDKDGRIDLDVPVEGTIDSPEFNYRKIVWQAVRKILGNLVKAPFRAIGRMFGRDEEDLDLVGFVSGRSELPEPEKETLAKLAAEIARKPEISVEVAGRYDPVTDAAALRRDRLERRIDARRGGEASLETILEALYSEAFSPERLAAERARFAPQPQPPESPPSAAAFDAAGFYDALRKQLLEAVPVGEADLDDLARARAEAVAAALTGPGGIEPQRVSTSGTAPVKRKKRGSDLVSSELTMTARD